MKKHLLTIIAALSVSAVVAQVPSPSLNINQDAIFPNPASVTFPGIKFLDAVDQNVVWTIGQDLAAPQRNYNWWSRSINGGSSFAGGNVFPDTNTYIIANMEGIDANTAWVSSFMKATSSQGAIHRTTNAGANWVNMTATGMYTNAAAFCNIVSFLTPSVGITMGDPVNGEYEIWRTTDGGLTWGQIPGANIPNPLTAGEYGIVNLYYKLGTSNLWFGTNQGRMYRTTDAGQTWSVSVVGASTATLIEIAFSSPMNGVCTLINNNAWELWNTTNGGATWSQISTISANFGYADLGSIPGTGMLVSVGVGGGNEIISSSSDNGVTWNDWGSTGIPYTTVDFVSNTTGWAGSLDFQTFSNMWKYSGAAIQGTTAPTSAFSIPANLCLSGPTATVIPVNTSTGSPMPTYSWSSSPAAVFSSPTATAPTITFASSGTYTITLIATNASGSNVSSQVITVAACIAPTASFTLPGNACTNYSFNVVNTSTGAPTPGYFWTISPSNAVTITPGPAAASPDFKIGNPGIYSITLVSTNASGTASTTQTVNVTSCPPAVNFTVPAEIAFCGSKTFSTTNSTTNPPGASGSITYTWSVSPNTGVSVFPNFFQQNLSVTISDPTISSYTVTLRARNASGTSTLANVVAVNDCSGLNENSLSALLGVYPNPAHDQLNISLPGVAGEYSVKITNLLGSVVYQEKSSKQNLGVNLANSARGVYFITVETKTEKVTRKIVLE